MNEKLTTSGVPESPKNLSESEKNVEQLRIEQISEEKKLKLQNEMYRHLVYSQRFRGDQLYADAEHLGVVRKFVEENSDNFECFHTLEFKKRIIYPLINAEPELVAEIKKILGYTAEDLEEVIFERATSRYSGLYLEDLTKKFGLSQKFRDRVTEEYVLQSLMDYSYTSNLDYNIKKLADLGDKERAENIIKTAIRRMARSNSFVSSGGWFVNVRDKFRTVFDVDEFLKSPEMRAIALARIQENLITGQLSDIEAWMKFTGCSSGDVKKLEKYQHFIDTLFYAELPPQPEKGEDPFWGFRHVRRNFYLLKEVKELFDLPDDVYETDIFRDQITPELNSLGLFRDADRNDVRDVLAKYHIKPEQLNTTDFKAKLIKETCSLLKHGGASGLERAKKLLANFGVLKLSDPEFRQPIIDVVVRRLTFSHSTDGVTDLLDIVNLSETEKKEIGVRTCVNNIKESRGNDLENIQKGLGITFDINSPEYISAAQETLVESLKNGDLRGISGLRFSAEFLARTEIRDLAIQAIILSIQKSYWELVKELKTLFHFEDNTIIEIALKHINHEQIISDSTVEIGDEENDEGEDDTEDVGDFISALQGIVPTLTVEHIWQASPKLQKYAEALQNRFSFITSEKARSFEFTIFLMETMGTSSEVFSALEKAPFLADAMEGNPRFAIKLLRQYSKLDNLSQENIAFLFKAKSEIKSEGVSDDLIFAEINKRLISYKDNIKVIEAYKKEGIDMDAWLNFPKETELNLVEGNESVSAVALSENFERLGNSYRKYLGSMKSGIEEYKEELAKKRLPSIDMAELDAQISQMRIRKESAELAGDQKRANGIQKGIDNLEKQKVNDKGVSVWLKVTSEFSKVEQKLSSFSSTFDELKKAESLLKELGELSSTERKGFPVFDIAFKDLERKGKLPDLLKKSSIEETSTKSDENPYEKFFAQKIKVNEAKKMCRESLDQFVKSFDSLTEWLGRDLSESLGSERYSAIIQEAKQSLGLDNDHMESDIRTVKSFFSERKEGMLDGRPMKISLWERDPDVDLYLGNYTDCCIRIDSEYHGAECVISDYLTDLGIQVAVVYDDKDKKPVLAAWLWVGKEKTTGEVSLVIDNIEANTDYTSQYSEVIGSKLKGYIKSYADAIGVDSIVQGSAHNDLVVADIIENKSYKKIGGYNRAAGYYLEAEGDDE